MTKLDNRIPYYPSPRAYLAGWRSRQREIYDDMVVYGRMRIKNADRWQALRSMDGLTLTTPFGTLAVNPSSEAGWLCARTIKNSAGLPDKETKNGKVLMDWINRELWAARACWESNTDWRLCDKLGSPETWVMG